MVKHRLHSKQKLDLFQGMYNFSSNIEIFFTGNEINGTDVFLSKFSPKMKTMTFGGMLYLRRLTL